MAIAANDHVHSHAHGHGHSHGPQVDESLGAGELILWQGAPHWRPLAQRMFHINALAIYFAVVAGWTALSAVHDGASIVQAVTAAVVVGSAFAAGGIGILALIAWLQARSTTYTITSDRVLMKFGAALPMTVNVPFKMVETADVKVAADGTADIPLTLSEGDRIPYGILWPHVRPWRFKNPTPMLRAVPDGENVAVLLAGALGEAETARTAKAKVSAEMPAVAGAGEGLATSMAQDEDPAGGRDDLGHGPQDHNHDSIAPRGALIAAASMVVFAILAVAANQLLGLN